MGHIYKTRSPKEAKHRFIEELDAEKVDGHQVLGNAQGVLGRQEKLVNNRQVRWAVYTLEGVLTVVQSLQNPLVKGGDRGISSAGEKELGYPRSIYIVGRIQKGKAGTVFKPSTKMSVSIQNSLEKLDGFSQYGNTMGFVGVLKIRLTPNFREDW